ncbi:hypothetical protein JTE90_000423 [Oedothorax gibbosus]|uniref:Secreted protein n=1 Tax=Oedothorax gibbosus TaxID=931172 RepID=A0AAV6TD27_9ARAC|nr:hypothetical protein JTE90_000423 [Oedothorax gibbosus]
MMTPLTRITSFMGIIAITKSPAERFRVPFLYGRKAHDDSFNCTVWPRTSNVSFRPAIALLVRLNAAIPRAERRLGMILRLI